MTCYSCGGNPGTWCQQCLPADDTWIAPVDKLPDVFMGDRDHLYMTPDGNFWALSPDRTKWMKVNGQGSNYKAGAGIRLDGDTIVNTQPNRDQSLSVSGKTLSISNGNSVTLPEDKQSLSLNGRTISITGGNSITLPEDRDTIYNDTELKRRIQAVEERTDNFVTGVAVSRNGNKVKLTYTFVNGAPKEVEFEDKDTITLAYDDSAIKARIKSLEDKPHRTVTRNINRTFEDFLSMGGVSSLRDVMEIPATNIVDGDLKEGDFINVEISDRSDPHNPLARLGVIYRVDRLDGGNAIVSKVPNSQKILGTGIQELRKEGNKLFISGGNSVDLPSPSTSYDDTDVKKRLTSLENKPDNDTKYSVTGDGLNMENNVIRFRGRGTYRVATTYNSSKYLVNDFIPLKSEYRTDKGSHSDHLKYSIEYDGTNTGSYLTNFFSMLTNMTLSYNVKGSLLGITTNISGTNNTTNTQLSNFSMFANNSFSGEIPLIYTDYVTIFLGLSCSIDTEKAEKYNSIQLRPYMKFGIKGTDGYKEYLHKVTYNELDSSEQASIEVKDGDNVVASLNFTFNNTRLYWKYIKPSLLLDRSSDNKSYYYD